MWLDQLALQDSLVLDLSSSVTEAVIVVDIVFVHCKVLSTRTYTGIDLRSLFVDRHFWQI